MLFGAFVVGVIVSLTTSLPGMIGLPQDTPAAILGLAAAAIAFSMRSADPKALYPTVVAAIMLTVHWYRDILFTARIGSSQRIDTLHTVSCDRCFLAGTGWLIAKGALGVMTNLPLSMANLSLYLQPDKLLSWLPGLVFAVALL